MTQTGLGIARHNPDVLTCIASLSNDEYFTPPDLARNMLGALEAAWASNNGGANIWENESVKFVDPCTKTGVFLREIVARLTKGLEAKIPDLAERVNHILTKQVFGIALTQLTAYMARRSVYCSKSANGIHSIARTFPSAEGNIWFQRVEHSWTAGKCVFCGANKRDYDRGETLETHAYDFIHNTNPLERVRNHFGGDMRFDVVIGNPPYQLGQSGGEAVGGFAMPVYQKFIQAAKSLDPAYLVMVTPSRWFAGGRGLDEFRAEMLADRRLRKLVDFPDATDAFPGTQIKGGVSYFLWDGNWSGECEVITEADGEQSPPMTRNLAEFDVLIRRNEAVPILRKVLRRNVQEGRDTFAKNVSPIQPFSIRTNFRGKASRTSLRSPVRLIGNGEDTFIERAKVPRNLEWVDKWKVLVGSAYGAGEGTPHQIYNYPIVAGPGTACTETYLVVGRFNSERQAKRCAAFLRTRFARFLVSLRKNTQHIYDQRFLYVPDIPMDRTWTDETLYEEYRITRNEIEFIESMIKSMDESDG
jgi:site-specific DNA-methyltransferase (adenine-specific)